MRRLPSNDVRLTARLVREARPFWRHLIVVLLLAILSAPLALLTPVPLKIAVDYVLHQQPLPTWATALLPASWTGDASALLTLAAALVVVAAVLQNIEGYASWFLQLYVGEKLSLRLKARLLAHVQKLSLLYHDTRGTADALYRIQYDAPAIQLIVVQGLVPLIASALTLLAMLYVMARISWPLAAIAMAVMPVLGVAGRSYRRHVRTGWEEVKRHESSTLAVLQETLGALRVVKAFGQERREEERYVTQAGLGVREQLRVVALESGFGLLVAAIVGLGTAAVLFVGVRQVASGQLTLGSLLLVMGYVVQLYRPLETMSKKMATLQASMASAERAYALLNEPKDVPERRRPRTLRRARGAVRFAHVYFEYAANRPVLRGVNLDIAPGTSVGVAGKTGSGKTTLVSLLPRFFDPVSGHVLLDGVDLREYQVADLRAQFAIVLQEPVLFSTTLAENIAYGRPAASRSEIEAAAEAAHALDFIRALPLGFDTRVGERGMTLSGGERQRVSLARAFLKDAPIVILDEPTSAVDRESETAILEAMRRLMKDRTTFMIAHRLDTLAECGLRLWVENGIVTAEPVESVAAAGSIES